MSDDLDHLLNLIDTHKRRLQIRELQAATFGNEMNEEALRILTNVATG